jgi:hypothetical protein
MPAAVFMSAVIDRLACQIYVCSDSSLSVSCIFVSYMFATIVAITNALGDCLHHAVVMIVKNVVFKLRKERSV